MAWYKILLIIAAAVFGLLQAVYWLNLDNKLLFYVVRPLLNKYYDRHQRTGSL